jgi:ferrous iron transport protein A
MPIPLAMLAEGDAGEIVGILAGKGLIRRLTELGFTKGEKIKVLHAHSPGPILVDIKDCRIAIGRGVAMKIMVNPQTAGEK